MKTFIALLALTALAACGHDFVPTPKKLSASTGANGESVITPPSPCPDWTHSASTNRDNSFHSNFGCATTHNLGIMLANPADINNPQGSHGAEPNTSTSAVVRYYNGQSTISSSSDSSSTATGE